MTLPDYSRSGFYDPTKDYPGYLQPQYPTFNVAGPSPVMQQLYRSAATDDPDLARAEFNRRLADLGLSGTGSRARAAQGLFGEAWGGYQQAKLRKNFNLFFPEYLDQTDLDRVIGSQSYEEQGLDPGRFGQGKYRWSMRRG
jgi:hypothetical protein